MILGRSDATGATVPVPKIASKLLQNQTIREFMNIDPFLGQVRGKGTFLTGFHPER